MNLSRTLPLALLLGLLGCSDGATPDVGGTDAATTEDVASAETATESGTETDAATTDTGIAPGTDSSGIDAPGPTASYGTKGAAAVTKSDTTVGGNKVHLLIPGGTPPADGFPAVVFAHGFQLREIDYDDLLGHVASYGYVVASTDYQASLLDNDHRKVRTAIVDLKNALVAGKVTGAPKVDAKRIAAAGHSLGGKCATWAAVTDPGFAATFVVDPVDGGGPLDTMSTPQRPFLIATGEVAKLTTPVGYVGATQSRCSNLGQTCAAEGKDAAAFFGATKAASRYLWTIFDFGHMQFLDNPACGFACSACRAGTSDVAARKTANKALFVAFLERHLRGDAAAQTWLDGAKRDENYATKVLWDGKIPRPACP